jgi:hypothetical protein
MARRLTADAPVKDPLRVNILGASALDGFDDSALDMLEDLIHGAGLKRGAIWGARSPLGEIRESGGAGANWVISAAALPLARFFRERFGIPFVAGLPSGSGETERIRSGLAACVRGDEPEAVFPPAPERGGGEGRRTLIVGEALLCASLRSQLENERGETDVGIATFFAEGRELLGPGDLFLDTEDDAVRAVSAPELETLIADPLVKGLISGGASPRFVPLPHRAVSGRLYDESRSSLFARPADTARFAAQPAGFLN